ncbi:uncharacterized protein B0H18DRAFT_243386 [Fomitopsis serialis]|uniref:uncharacterized protein n=1 Tax=Fomitopsis serialis TaxID=139415 RepID=UPI0020087CB4|nr:uncharacterized protein B0H18DRAFT_243386 [Neoantrodia serialis]KAH9928632.1 hypothetical protein B0H18DRAFT_243386 [Neoantrodia serialis]
MDKNQIIFSELVRLETNLLYWPSGVLGRALITRPWPRLREDVTPPALPPYVTDACRQVRVQHCLPPEVHFPTLNASSTRPRLCRRATRRTWAVTRHGVDKPCRERAKRASLLRNEPRVRAVVLLCESTKAALLTLRRETSLLGTLAISEVIPSIVGAIHMEKYQRGPPLSGVRVSAGFLNAGDLSVVHSCRPQTNHVWYGARNATVILQIVLASCANRTQCSACKQRSLRSPNPSKRVCRGLLQSDVPSGPIARVPLSEHVLPGMLR